MNEPSENTPDWEAQRDRIIGLGETSLRKSYYPELQQRIQELEKKNRELQAAHAAQTAIEEELRQQFDETSHKERALQVNEERLVMAQEIGHTGSWEYSFETDQIWGSAEALRIYGFPPDAGYHPREEIEACIEDREQARQAFADFLSGRKGYDLEITLNPHDGSPRRVVRSIARLEKDEQGRPIRAVGAILDITGSKRADKALRESEERFRQIFENSPVGMTLVTPEFRFFSVNPAWVAMTGYSEEELLNLSFPDITHPDHTAGDTEHIRALIEGKIPVYNTEKRYIRKDGSILWGLLRVTTIRDPQGNLRFLAAQIEDITEGKRAAEALRESEGRFRTLIEASPLPITLTREGIFIYANSAFCRMTGYSDPAEVTGKPLLDFVAPEFREKVAGYVRGRQRGEPVDLHYESAGIRRDGSRFPYEITVSVIEMPGGLVTMAFIADITERRQAEDALRTSEERYRSLVDITDTGYAVLDSKGLIIDANEVYVKLTGHTSLAEITGHSVTEWTAPYDLERNAREVEKCVRTGHVRGLEIDYARPDGTFQPVEINATVFHSGSGDVILTLCRDISSRKQTDVALQQARNKLNLLNAVTFQDIQTAAFSLSAYQELVRTAIVDPKALSYIAKQEIFLKKMVDTLDFAKNYQEMGMHPPRWQNVRQVFLYAISHLDFLHMKQNLHLGTLEIFADPLFEKALFNIMENVLAHGVSATEVTLRYEEKPDHLTLLIEDNGVGIPAEEKNMIFDRGYGKGTGLGLFLVREVLSITGMTIKETGMSRRGTRFEITVPKGMYHHLDGQETKT